MPISRHFCRIVAMQSLYEWDFRQSGPSVKDITERNLKEGTAEIDKKDKEFIFVLIDGVLKNLKEIDEIIKVAAPEWPINQIAAVDRTILRLGIFELLYLKEIPPKVAINEAIELGKAFGGENSGKFVNGVLGTIYRNSDLYKEEEESTLAKASLDKEEKKETSKIEAAGGLVYREEDKKIYFLLVKDRFLKWTIPKGKIEAGEEASQAAGRETREETGISNLELISELGKFKLFPKKEGEKIQKTVDTFLFKTNEKKVDMAKVKDPEIKEVKWFEIKDAIKNAGYKNTEELINEAVRIIRESKIGK